MITRRLLTIQMVFLLGLSGVFLMPQKTGLGPAGIAMRLPDSLDEWQGEDAKVTELELKGLAPDTKFARRFYKNAAGDVLYVSIVLSGEDMANSIHRPERCLAAQGWTVERAARLAVPLAGGGAPLAITRLTNEREWRTTEGKTIPRRNLNYYWFIGSHDVTASHWTRTLIDVKDRLLYGENQRWAYVTVASDITDNLKPGGHSEADTAALAENFIGRIVPHFEKP